MAKQATQLSIKKKKKNWVSILAPKEFRSMELGKTLAFESENTIGREIEYNYSLLSGDPKKQHIELVFKVEKAREGFAETGIYEYKIWQAYLKRMVRKARTKIDDSFEVKTKDGFKVKVKPFIITRGVVHRSVQTDIRKKVMEMFILNCEKKTFTQAVLDLINYSIQKEIKNEIKRLTPIASFEIRWFKRIKA